MLEGLKKLLIQKQLEFVAKTLRLERLMSDTDPSFEEGLAKGYWQGVRDAAMLLGAEVAKPLKFEN